MEKLDYLIQYLLKENKAVVVEKIPQEINLKKKLYRSLCNIRDPKPISKEYLQIEQQYLQEELKKKEITKADQIESIAETNPNTKLKNIQKIALWKGDITTLQIDAIVNAANSQGIGCFIPCHSCIDNQIHSAAGISLRLDCYNKMKEKVRLKTSETMLTKGYSLPASYIIHTVGPIIQDTVNGEKENQLAQCYQNCLKLAIQEKIKTIAFCCISTGEFHFPKELACKIAIDTVNNFLEEHQNSIKKVVFNVFNKEDFEIYENNIG